MPANPRQPNRSWRDEKKTTDGAGPGKRGWQKETTAAAGTKGPLLTRRGKIALAVGGLLLGVVVIAVVLWMLRPVPVPVFVLVGSGYETNLAVPENVAGVRGLDEIKSWADGYNTGKAHEQDKVKVLRHVLHTEADPDPVDAAVEKIMKERDAAASKVIVYLAVHGAADTTGPYLIPNDANLRSGFATYRLSKVLTAMKKLPPDTKKFLMLDTTGVVSDWSMGLLHNDFARALLEHKADLKDVKNLVVLVASDEDQRSCASEEWGTSIFAHYVAEGLKGAPEANANGRVTAGSLARYVTKEVEQWARDNRDALQTPLLIDDDKIADDMELISVDSSAYKPPAADALPTFTVPPELKAAWKMRAELQASQPHPAVYTPQLWRQYLEMLVRYERLLRFNDQANATALAGELGNLANRIRKAQHVDHPALALSLAMPGAFGWSLSDADARRTQEDFTTLWGQKPKAESAAFDALLKTEWKRDLGGRLPDYLLRLRMCALLLQQARESESDFTRVCEVLPAVDDVVPPYRPAEAHFARMLNQYLPEKGRDWAQMKAALEVRLQAEEAALGVEGGARKSEAAPSYSEQVLPWIKTGLNTANIQRADKSRRTGEDLLFVSAVKSAESKATDKARVDYTEVQKKAALVRQALFVRDRVLTELPYYTDWLSQQDLSDDEVLEIKQKLWDKVHELCRLLAAEPDFDKIDGLTDPAAKVTKEMDRLVARFERSLKAAQADNQRTLQDIESLLRVPFIEAGRRMELLEQLRATSYRLNSSKTSGTQGLTKAQNSALRQKVAQRQGWLALAALGEQQPEYKEAEPAVAKPEEGAWGRSLAKASERLGDAYRRIAVKLYQDTDDGRKAPLDKAHSLLRPAALQCRYLPGAVVGAWPTLDPVGENRRVDLHDLLVFQAKRTFDDYWASTDANDPYYRSAGKVYLSVAKAQAGADNPALNDKEKVSRLAQANQLEEELNKDDALTPRWLDGVTAKAGPAEWYITDATRVVRTFKLETAPSAPEGIPAVWAKLGKRLQLANPEEAERRALSREKDKVAEITYDLKVTHPQPVLVRREESQCDFTGFFRGRVATLETKVSIFHLPEIASYQPLFEEKGRIAVKANPADYDRFAAANSELVIVLDYSGSMTKPTKETKGKAVEVSRKAQALDALRQVLTKIPRGVKVTVLTFSTQEDSGEITVRGGEKTEWDPSSENVDRRIGFLRTLTPKYTTPLVRATVEAKMHFSPENIAKTVLILTDGGDNEFNSDRGADMRREAPTMKKYLAKHFDGSGIAVNVIGIETDLLDPKEDKEEYDGLQEYKPAIEAINGKFVTSKGSAALAREIEAFLLQIRYRIDAKSVEARVPFGALPEEGADISRERENYRWIRDLKAGESCRYEVSLQTNRLKKRAIVQDVDLDRGDALVLKLQPVPRTNQFQLRREMYAESFSAKAYNKAAPEKSATDPSWQAAVLQNQRIETGRPVHPLQIMTAIEKVDDPEATLLRLVRPHFVWCNVSSTDQPGKLVPGLRFYPLPDYPAAAYSLDLPEWSKRGKDKVNQPILDLWWNQAPLINCAKLRLKDDAPLPDFSPHELRPAKQDVSVFIESITYETLKVEVNPKEFKELKDCLVVRVRYPKEGKPFFAQLGDARGTVSEQRFYLEAGKCTSIFFDPSGAKLRKPDELLLYSVEEAQKEAHKVTGWTLPEPDASDRPAKPRD